MKKIFYIATVFVLLIELKAQTYTRYFVAFKDKNNTAYSVSNPLQFLSQRAINRRSNQGISVTSDDFPPNASYIQSVKNTGAVIMCRSRWFNGVLVQLTSQSQLSAINALSCVQSSKPLAKVRSTKKIIPLAQQISSERAASVQSDRFNYGQSQNQVYMLNGECLHNQGYDGHGMQIGIIDDGFSNAPGLTALDSLFTQNRVIATHDFFTGNNSVYNEGGHGTEVLSCIGANLPGQMVGTAPLASFYLLRSEIDSTEKITEEYQWNAAIEYADSAGADVINSSLGYTSFDDGNGSHSWSDLNGKTSVASLSATMAARRGMIVCIAAGNEGSNGWQKISVPADADSILAVGSVDAGGAYSGFSSRGNSADGRIKPDVAAQGGGTTVAYTNNSIGPGSGTSFASPTLAGMVSCLWQGNPTKKNMEVIAAIKQSATQYQHPDSILGYGIPDFCVADQILKGNNSVFSFIRSEMIDLCDGTGDCSLSVNLFDMNGRLLAKEEGAYKVNQTYAEAISVLNMSTLSEGLYIVRIISSNGRSLSKKVLK